MSEHFNVKKKVILYSFLLLITIAAVVLILLLLTNWQVKKHKPGTKFFGDFPVVSDSEIGFVARKNSSTFRFHAETHVKYYIYTDSRGARVNKPGKKAPESVKIITIGGSFSWGHGIENEETFTELLGKYLNVSAANFAYGSYGTLQSLQLLKRNVDLKPQIIIYGIVSDHIRRNLFPCAPSYYPFCSYVSYIDFNQEGNPIIKKPISDFNHFIYKVQNLRKCSEQGFSITDLTMGLSILLEKARKKMYLLPAMKNYKNRAKRIKSLDFLISEMKRVAKGAGATLIVMYIPNFNKKILSPPKDLLEIFKTQKECIFLDLTDAVNSFLKTNQKSLLMVHREDGHPSAVAHKLMADELKKVILLNRLLKDD